MSAPAPKSVGHERWSFASGGSGPIVGVPLVVAPHVCFTKGDGLYVLDRANGRLLWSRSFVRRRGLARFWRTRQDDFEARHGVPTLSSRREMLVVSYQDPEHGPIDVAFDLERRRPIELEADGFHPLTTWGPSGFRLEIESPGEGYAPVVRATDRQGGFLWDSLGSVGAGIEGAAWMAPAGRPVIGAHYTLLGIRETDAPSGQLVAYRIFALRLSDGGLAWHRSNRARDADLTGMGFADPFFWMLARQTDGTSILRYLDPRTGEHRKEARFPGLTGGVSIADQTLYGAFGKSLLAVELTL